MTDPQPWQRSAPAAIPARELAALESFVAETVRDAGRLTLEYFRAPTKVHNKAGGGAFDPVTQADRAAETLIRERIASRFPGHGVLGEEHGYDPGTDGLTWVIDPIDGTGAFITGALHWGVLVALFDGVRPCLGAMYQPYSGELFMGSANGAWLEREGLRRPLATRPCASIEDAALCTTTPAMFRGEAEQAAFARLAERALLVRYGGDCYSYCMLAMGMVDLVVESSLHAYDIQALIPIVEAAGGGIVSWDGGSAAVGGSVLAYGDPALRATVLACLRGTHRRGGADSM